MVGMRFRLEPQDVKALFADFRAERSRVKDLLAKAADEAGAKPLSLWPLSLSDYLSRRLGAQFTVRWYRLNPGGLVDPDSGTKMARPQLLSPSALPLDSNPLNGLVRVHEIGAQRGFGDTGEEGEEGSLSGHGGKKLITDLDAGNGKDAVPVERGQGQSSNNPTLKRWMLDKDKDASVDVLLDLEDADKVIEVDDLYALRIAYQTPVKVNLPKTDAQVEALPGTFEDALVLSNVEHFMVKSGKGLRRKFAEILSNAEDASELGKGLFNGLRKGDKAEFTLSVLADPDFDHIKAPDYILEGLRWLEDRLRRKKKEILLVVEPVTQQEQGPAHGEEGKNA
jgi:hypothetical protein